MNYISRRLSMNAHVLSGLEYISPILAGKNAKTQDRIYKVILKQLTLSEAIIRESITSIMRSVKWKMPKEFLEEYSARLVHKILF